MGRSVVTVAAGAGSEGVSVGPDRVESGAGGEVEGGGGAESAGLGVVVVVVVAVGIGFDWCAGWSVPFTGIGKGAELALSILLPPLLCPGSAPRPLPP